MTEKRGVLARLGLVLLNIPAPGVGLLRLGRWHVAASMFGLLLAILLFMRFGPPAPFAVWALAMILLIAVLLGSMILSWRLSRNKEHGLSRWRRWYAIAGTAILINAIAILLMDKERMAYRNFYLPAESMSPALLKGDRFVAYMRRPQVLKRGDVVLVRTPRGDIYVKRLAGLPGDRIGMKNGILFLNGAAVPQKLVATEQVKDVVGIVPARRLTEQFSGELRPHEIYDLGRSVGDQFGPVLLGAGQYFLLGDHRDRSADSRFSRKDFGLEPVKSSDIVGKALFYSWGSSRPIGQRIGGNR